MPEITFAKNTKIDLNWAELLPKKGSHKGQNGKLMIIGGSELFHAPLNWCLTTASRLVDMVFVASTAENNALIEAKEGFWEGIVIAQNEIENYISEADCILIGPGMTRDERTTNLTNEWVGKFPHKKWVIDAGALQMIDLSLINRNCILTPNSHEYLRIRDFGVKSLATILLKGERDSVLVNDEKVAEIIGGSEGMIKGGSGDCLAGLVAGFYCFLPASEAVVMASFVCKRAGEELQLKQGVFYNASDLAAQIPIVLSKLAENIE